MKKLDLLILATIAVLFASVHYQCSVLKGATQIDEMTDAQFQGYAKRTANWAAVAAQALVEEEVVTEDDLARVAQVIRAVTLQGVGAGSVNVLSDALEADGWKQAALLALFGELDAKLEGCGFWDLYGERQQVLLMSIADKLDQGEG